MLTLLINTKYRFSDVSVIVEGRYSLCVEHVQNIIYGFIFHSV